LLRRRCAPSKDPKLRALVAYTRARLDSIQLAVMRLVDIATKQLHRTNGNRFKSTGMLFAYDN